MAGGPARRLFADLPVQHPQGLEDVVVQVAPKHKGQHQLTQRIGRAVAAAGQRRHHPALEPGKTLPFAALDLEILLQRTERDRWRAGIAVGPQGQIDPEHKAMLGDITDQGIDRLDLLGKIFLIGDHATAVDTT